jgi:uncharacterized protein
LGRIILLIIIGFLIYLVLRGFFRSQLKKPTDSKPPVNAEDMVRCERCGVNLPRSEATEQDGKLVCRENPNCR